MTDAGGQGRSGVLYALGAYLVWGLLPLYFALLGGVDPVEIVADRVLWSALLLGIVVVGWRHGAALRVAFRQPRLVATLALTAVLIGINWLVYVWAVLGGHVLAASLGYFLNPLVNVVLGVVFLRERLGRAQGVAVALAASGVAVLAAGALDTLWISVTLALSFATYGLLRKVAAVGALAGLTIETLLLAPAALAFVAWRGAAGDLAFGQSVELSALLAFAGVLTAVPLLSFAAAARRLPLSTLGLLQYLSPTMQFVLAITVFGEPLRPEQAICFALIWTGLATYAVAGRRQRRPVAA